MKSKYVNKERRGRGRKQGWGEEMVGGTRVGRRIWGWILALRVVLGKTFLSEALPPFT